MRAITVSLAIMSFFSSSSNLVADPQKGGQAEGGSFVDAEGKPIKESVVPEDIRKAVKFVVNEPKNVLRKGVNNADLPDAALVLGRVAFPAAEADQTFSSTLVGNGWNGGMHYLSPGGVSISGADNPKNVICIRLLDFNGACTLEASKLGYQTAKLKVPVEGMQGKIIWMGELKLEPHSLGLAKTVGGVVNDASGSPLAAPGKVSLRVNGSSIL